MFWCADFRRSCETGSNFPTRFVVYLSVVPSLPARNVTYVRVVWLIAGHNGVESCLTDVHGHVIKHIPAWTILVATPFVIPKKCAQDELQQSLLRQSFLPKTAGF